MARTRGSAGLRARGPRRSMIWVRDTAESATTTSATDLLTDFRTLNGGAQPLGCTVVRLRGRLLATVSAASTAATRIVVGAIVLPRTLTAAEVPAPITDQHADWMAWVPFDGLSSGAASATGFSTTIDVRSMRKMDEVGETLWLSWESSGLVTGLHWDLSALVKLA